MLGFVTDSSTLIVVVFFWQIAVIIKLMCNFELFTSIFANISFLTADDRKKADGQPVQIGSDCYCYDNYFYARFWLFQIKGQI